MAPGTPDPLLTGIPLETHAETVVVVNIDDVGSVSDEVGPVGGISAQFSWERLHAVRSLFHAAIVYLDQI